MESRPIIPAAPKCLIVDEPDDLGWIGEYVDPYFNPVIRHAGKGTSYKTPRSHVPSLAYRVISRETRNAGTWNDSFRPGTWDLELFSIRFHAQTFSVLLTRQP